MIVPGRHDEAWCPDRSRLSGFLLLVPKKVSECCMMLWDGLVSQSGCIPTSHPGFPGYSVLYSTVILTRIRHWLNINNQTLLNVNISVICAWTPLCIGLSSTWEITWQEVQTCADDETLCKLIWGQMSNLLHQSNLYSFFGCFHVSKVNLYISL